jgi:hypothetical protein
MKEAKDILRMVVVIVLALFVLIAVVPILLKLIGFTIGVLVWLAVKVIYLAVVLAVCYLILVGIRAILR